MTKHDLSTLIRDEFEHEPAFALSSEQVIMAGRREVARRRWAASLATAAVFAGAALVLPGLLGGGSTAELDAASADSLQHFDPDTFPRVFDQAVDETLNGVVPEFAGERITAYGGEDQTRRLAPENRDDASWWSAVYNWTDRHWLAVNLFHAQAESEGDPDQYCREQLAAGYAIECTIERDSNGAVLITQVSAARKGSGDNPNGTPLFFGLTNWQNANPDSLWFDRVVQARRGGIYLAYARETVKAPSLEAAHDEFHVTVDALRELSLHPDLVFPEPSYGQ